MLQLGSRSQSGGSWWPRSRRGRSGKSRGVGALQDVVSGEGAAVVSAGGCLFTGRWGDGGGGTGGGDLKAGPQGLTITGDVGADALVTLLPKATVAPGVADPVVGGSGQNDEGVGQEAQHGAPALKALLHPHARGTAAKDHACKTDPCPAQPQVPGTPSCMPLHIPDDYSFTPAWGFYFWGPLSGPTQT